MAATPEQKRRQQLAHQCAVRLIRAEHPDLWADAYRRARHQVDNGKAKLAGDLPDAAGPYLDPFDTPEYLR